MAPQKPVVPAALLGDVHRIPQHYFVTPRRSGLPFGYFGRRWFDIHDVVVVLVVVCFVIGLVVTK